MRGLFACLFALGLLLTATESFADGCGKDAPSAIATARENLKTENPQEERRALECLIQAVGALEEKVYGLSNGTIAFEGQVYAPKGFAVSKPSTREGK